MIALDGWQHWGAVASAPLLPVAGAVTAPVMMSGSREAQQEELRAAQLSSPFGPAAAIHEQPKNGGAECRCRRVAVGWHWQQRWQKPNRRLSDASDIIEAPLIMLLL